MSYWVCPCKRFWLFSREGGDVSALPLDVPKRIKAMLMERALSHLAEGLFFCSIDDQCSAFLLRTFTISWRKILRMAS